MAGNTPSVADFGDPAYTDTQFYTGIGTGVINEGDHLIYSGGYVIPTAMAANGANALQVLASGAGYALGANPVYDSHGVQKENTALLFADNVRLMVSAYHKLTATGDVPLGTRAYPATTGSGVNAPTGNTGLGAQWGTAAPKSFSGATAAAAPVGNAIIVGIKSFGDASGATQMEILYRAHGHLGYGG